MNWKLLLIALALFTGISARPADESNIDNSTLKIVVDTTNPTEQSSPMTDSPIEIITKKVIKTPEKNAVNDSSSTVQIPTTTVTAATTRYLASQSLQTKSTNAKKKYANNYANLITKHTLNSQKINNKKPNITVDNYNSNKNININNYIISSDSHASINNSAYNNSVNKNVTTNKNIEKISIPIATISSPTTSNSSSNPLVFVDSDALFSHLTDLSTTKRAFINVNSNSQPGSWSNYDIEGTSEQALTTRKKPVIHKIISKWSDNPNEVFNLHVHEPLIVPSQQAQLDELKNQIIQSAYKQQQKFQTQFPLHENPTHLPLQDPHFPIGPLRPPIPIAPPISPIPVVPPQHPPIPVVPPPIPSIPVVPPQHPPIPVVPPQHPPVLVKPQIHTTVTSFDHLPTLVGQQLIHHQQHINTFQPTLAITKPPINSLLLLNKPSNFNSLKDYCKQIRVKLGNKFSTNFDNDEHCKGLNIFIDNKIDNTNTHGSTSDYELLVNDKFEDPPIDEIYDSLAHQIETEPDPLDPLDIPTSVTVSDQSKDGNKNKNKKKKHSQDTDLGSMVMTVMTMMAVFNPLNFGVWGIILAPVAAITLGGACFVMYQIMTHQHKEKQVWNPPSWPKPQEIIIRNKINHSAIPIKITHFHKKAPVTTPKKIYNHPQIHNAPVMEYSPPWHSAPTIQPSKSYGEPPVDSYFPSAPNGGPYRRKINMSKPYKNHKTNPFQYKLL